MAMWIAVLSLLLSGVSLLLALVAYAAVVEIRADLDTHRRNPHG